MTYAHQLAVEAAKKARVKQKKKGYYTGIIGALLKPNDRCLVKIFERTHKLANKSEHEPHAVLRQPNSTIAVYKVRRVDGQGKIKTINQNFLLTVG